MKVTAARTMNPGRTNNDGGSSFPREIRTAFSVSLRHSRLLQKPDAKLLNHNAAKGRKRRSLERTAASMNKASVKLETREDNKV